MSKYKLLIDTNVFLLLYEGVDIFEELSRTIEGNVELYTLDCVVDEIRKLASTRSGRRGMGARMLLNEKVLKKVKVLRTNFRECNADEAILRFVTENPEYIVVTLDSELRKRLKDKGVRVLTRWRSMGRFSQG
jgi:rRNA-processing protein FCF1